MNLNRKIFKSLVLIGVVSGLSACSLYKNNKSDNTNNAAIISSADSSTKQAQVGSAHNSRNSLDWANTYVGVVPCASCPGIKTRLTLKSDGQYELVTQYIDRQTKPDVVDGHFEWNATGNSITLDEKGFRQQYAVQEGQLIMLYQDGAMPQGPLAPHHVLKAQSGF